MAKPRVYRVSVVQCTIEHFDVEVGSGPFFYESDATRIALEQWGKNPSAYKRTKQEVVWGIDKVERINE